MVLSPQFEGYASGSGQAASLGFSFLVDAGSPALLPDPAEVAEAIAQVFMTHGYTSVGFYGKDVQEVVIYPPSPQEEPASEGEPQ